METPRFEFSEGVVIGRSGTSDGSEASKPVDTPSPGRSRRGSVSSISVVVNNYNYGRFIRPCLDSVMRQVVDLPVEVIFVDDGSTDDSLTILSPYRDGMTVITQDNRGQGAAINAGVAAATGDLIFLLDSDDVWEPGKLASCVHALAAHPDAVAIQHGYRLIDGGGNAAGPGKGKDLSQGRLSAREVVEMQAVLAPTSCFGLRASAVGAVFPIPEDIFPIRADFFLHAMLCEAGKLLAIPAELTQYRLHGDNQYSGRFSEASARADLKRTRAFADWLLEERQIRVNLGRSFYYSRAETVRRRRDGRPVRAILGSMSFAFQTLLPWRKVGPPHIRLARALVVLTLAISPTMGIALFNFLTGSRVRP